MSETLDLIHGYLKDRHSGSIPADGLQPDTSLLGSRVLDSMAILELVAYLEQTFAIQVADDELVPEHFDSLEAIARYVAMKTQT